MPQGELAFEEIFDSLFDDQALEHLLGKLAAHTGARSAIVGWHSRDHTATLFRHNWHWSAEQIAEYEREHAFTDAWNVAQLHNWQPNRAMNLEDLVPPHVFEMSTLYNDFFRKHGDDTFRCLSLPTGNEWGVGAVALHRGRDQPAFEPEAQRWLDRYAAQITRVLGLRGRLHSLELANSSLETVLDTLGQPVMLVDRSGRIARLNAAAKDLIDSNPDLYINAGVLQCRSPTEQRQLDDAFRKAHMTAAPQASAIAIRVSGHRKLEFSIIQVSSGGARYALVIVTSPGTRAHIETRLRTVYRLTLSEARVAMMMAEGLTLAEIAERRNASLGTVKVQVRNIASKMECSRQSDIVRLVRSLPPLR